MFDKLKDRRIHIIIALVLIFVFMIHRLATLTLVKGDYYREQALNNRLRKVKEIAKRGDIYDRNGVLIAGNEPGFVVNVSGSLMSKSMLNDVAIKLFDILENEGEEHVEFPIEIIDGEFYYKYDLELQNWLKRNGFSINMSATDVYNELLKRECIYFEPDPYEAQHLLMLRGITPPISVITMDFISILNKNDFLNSYGLDYDISAKEAFKKIRSLKEFGIEDDVSDNDAYKILVLKHILRSKGYLKYEPIEYASSLKRSTAILINELSMELPGVSVTVRPHRVYPYNEIAAHILGYMGSISTPSEIQYYVDEHGYDRNQLIGKVGIEGNRKFELALKGENGYKYVEVDAFGRLVREVETNYNGVKSKKSVAGKDIVLSIDMELQKVATDALIKGINGIHNGTVFESVWGDYKYRESFPNAETGAVVVVDVNTGEVLALANYPSYDINLFSSGIKAQDWQSLQPINVKNPLSPRPLYNISTMMAAEPGSIYKMITGFAAAKNGMDPYKKVFSNGHIKSGHHNFKCWYYNDYGGIHGYVNLVEALKMSCNYFFFDISMGYDYYKDKALDFKMDAKDLIEASKLFGLDERSGIEIYETVKGVPDPEKKKKQMLNNLRYTLNHSMADYFSEEIYKNQDKKNKIIDEIISWSELKLSRNDIIIKLMKLTSKSYIEVEPLADLIKYSYFDLMDWYEGDTFNMAIGQGGHEYTVVQMARYISTIANGGYNNKLTLIKSIGNTVIKKNYDVTNNGMNDDGILDIIKEGMYKVANEKRGTAYSVFKNFPIKVAGKTGTAQRIGKIPPSDELKYLQDNLKKIDKKLELSDVQKQANLVLRRRNAEIQKFREEKSSTDDVEQKKYLDQKINNLISYGYLSPESTFRCAIKELSEKDLNDWDINEYRKDYNSHGWFVSFAPYDEPEIAIVVLVPQGGHGSYVAPIAREIYAHYFGLYDTIDKEDDLNKSGGKNERE